MASAAIEHQSDKTFDSNVKLSKSLSWLLRHGAEKEGVHMDDGGFVYIEDILKLNQFKKFTIDDVRRVVTNNDKQRFTISSDKESGKLKIRANQGHSVQVDNLELIEITTPDDIPIAIHGTYAKYWGSIKQQGLSRMNRNHVHLATGEPGEDRVISGMRWNCDILIYINTSAAMKDGLKFFKSANNVILCAGNERGFILPKYFNQVLDRKTKSDWDR